MELKYQSLKNLCDKLLRGRKGMTQEAVEVLDKQTVAYMQEVLDVACEEADIANRKLIKGVHIERAVMIIKRR